MRCLFHCNVRIARTIATIINMHYYAMHAHPFMSWTILPSRTWMPHILFCLMFINNTKTSWIYICDTNGRSRALYAFTHYLLLQSVIVIWINDITIIEISLAVHVHSVVLSIIFNKYDQRDHRTQSIEDSCIFVANKCIRMTWEDSYKIMSWWPKYSISLEKEIVCDFFLQWICGSIYHHWMESWCLNKCSSNVH